MRKIRTAAKKKSSDKILPDKELGNGPSKLTQAMCIDKITFNKDHVDTCEKLWLEDGDEDISEEDIVTSYRIGIDSAGEKWAKAPLRFYLLGNKSVSKRDKVAEGEKRQKTE